jgi:Domain of unknown function (DUF4202)
MSAVVTPKGELRVPLVSSSLASRRKTRAATEPEITHLRLVADADEELDTSTIVREFPTLAVERAEQPLAGDLIVDDFAWRGSFDFCRFDDAVEHARPVGHLAVRGTDAVGVAVEVMARYQRLLVRRNHASSTPLFDAILEAHASLFDLAQPLARADFDHALDTWQWMLRIAPNIGIAPQVAALFHDIDRLESEPHERIEHRAHRVLDDTHARRGGERSLAILRGVGMEEEEALRVRDLVGGRAQAEADAVALDEADALSFLSLLSPRYADYFGLAQTRRKVTFTLGRLGPGAREKVALFRLRPDVERLLQPG